jgi:hypothetical protein
MTGYNHGLSPTKCSNERAAVRRVLPDECFEPASFWKIPTTFNEAASGFSPAHAPGVVPTDESPAHRPASSTSLPGAKRQASPPLTDRGQATAWDCHHQPNTHARTSATVPSRPIEPAPLHVRTKRFVQTGSRIVAHSLHGVTSREELTRSPARLANDMTWVDPSERLNSGMGHGERGSSAGSESSRRRLLGSASSSMAGDEAQLFAKALGTDA